jgi:hypothetical protein
MSAASIPDTCLPHPLHPQQRLMRFPKALRIKQHKRPCKYMPCRHLTNSTKVSKASKVMSPKGIYAAFSGERNVRQPLAQIPIGKLEFVFSKVSTCAGLLAFESTCVPGLYKDIIVSKP